MVVPTAGLRNPAFKSLLLHRYAKNSRSEDKLYNLSRLKAKTKAQYIGISEYLDQMEWWAEEWQMEFNLDKCEMLHFGNAHQGRTYTLN
eukprot:g37837.t1